MAEHKPECLGRNQYCKDCVPPKVIPAEALVKDGVETSGAEAIAELFEGIKTRCCGETGSDDCCGEE